MKPGKAGPASARMAAKLQTSHGRKGYKKRKAIVEPVFGWIKQVVGFRSFSLRASRRSEQSGAWSAWRPTSGECTES